MEGLRGPSCVAQCQGHTHTHTHKYAVKCEDRVSAGGQGYQSLDVLFLHVH